MNILLECPICKWDQMQRFKNGKTIELLCVCNVNAQMYNSVNKSPMVKYGLLVDEYNPYTELIGDKIRANGKN